MKAPVSVCMIVRDEAPRLAACVASIVDHVEQIVIVDTGSTDGTPDQWAAMCTSFTKCNDADGRMADFSMARNHAFSLATQPWVMWVDGDDEVEGGEHLAEVIATHDRVRKPGQPCQILLPYEYSHDELGNCNLMQYRERLVSPASAFEWRWPVHEGLHPTQPNTLMSQGDAIKIVHRGEKKLREPGRNLRILRAAYDAGDITPRTLFYLAQEYGIAGDAGASLEFHRKYIARSDWDDEKCLSCLAVARHYEHFGDHEQARHWAVEALCVRETWFEAYFAIGRSWYFTAKRGGRDEQRNWERAVHFFQLGLAQPPTCTNLFVNPLERTHEVHKFLNVALERVNRIEEARDSCEAGLRVKPDEGMTANRALYVAFIARQTIDIKLAELVSINRIGRMCADRIRSDLDTAKAPDSMAKHREKAPWAIDIIVYIGQSWEKWSPDTAKTAGIGGSETAVVEMTRRWAFQGHRVRVYAEAEGMFDGVEWISFERFGGTSCDVLVTSRRPDALDAEFCDARLRFCWVHDVHLGALLTHARALRCHRFLALSEWHKANILRAHRQIHPDQVLVTRNGIDLSRFATSTAYNRDPKRAIYSSSWDRGLEVLLKVWPRIRERVPHASLGVFYGCETWEAMAAKDPQQWAPLNRIKAMLAELKDHGVTNHGRVPQERLAKEFLYAGVWTYPTWFPETSCITAMEAQAAGCRIVTSPIAALRETVGARGTLIEGDWLSDAYQDAFVEATVTAMTTPGMDDRVQLHEYAQAHFGWDAVASEWLEQFRTVPDVMPDYQAWLQRGEQAKAAE